MQLDLQQNQNNITIPFEKIDDSQKQVVFKVMLTLKKWLEKSFDFVPLRMTVRGMPGSGKSTVIKFLRKTMHQIFGQHECTLTCAPTGNAAHNVQGGTIHRSWEVSHATSSKLNLTARKHLISRMNKLVLLIVDECSLLDAQTLGNMHRNAQATVHKGKNTSESWGGFPLFCFLVIIFSFLQSIQEFLSPWMRH